LDQEAIALLDRASAEEKSYATTVQ